MDRRLQEGIEAEQRVAMRELKMRLSGYLRRFKTGEIWSLIGLGAGAVLVLTLALFLALDRSASSPALSLLDASPDWTAGGEGKANQCGYSVGTAGDVIGAYGHDDSTGRAYLYLGEGE